MIGRKSIVGLSLLAVFAFSAFAAQGASAAWESAKNAAAYTCVPGGGENDFSDSHCDTQVTAGTGSFGHVEIAAKEKTDIESSGGESHLRSSAFGLSVEINCKKVGPDSKVTSYIENNGTAPTHQVEGTSAVLFEECVEEGEVGMALGCEVVSPITVNSLFHGVEEPVNKTMALEFTPDGTENFVQIFYKPGCAVGEGPFNVKGSAKGTSAGVAPNKKWSGATVKFEPGNGMESLTFGTEAAEFEATLTTKMVGGNPIATTTPTG